MSDETPNTQVQQPTPFSSSICIGSEESMLVNELEGYDAETVADTRSGARLRLRDTFSV